jgi:hypothetical protein
MLVKHIVHDLVFFTSREVSLAVSCGFMWFALFLDLLASVKSIRVIRTICVYGTYTCMMYRIPLSRPIYVQSQT